MKSYRKEPRLIVNKNKGWSDHSLDHSRGHLSATILNLYRFINFTDFALILLGTRFETLIFTRFSEAYKREYAVKNLFLKFCFETWGNRELWSVEHFQERVKWLSASWRLS